MNYIYFDSSLKGINHDYWKLKPRAINVKMVQYLFNRNVRDTQQELVLHYPLHRSITEIVTLF